jgi:hypothetical protein
MPGHGWYLDPADRSRWRWWDGESWTSIVSTTDNATEESALPPTTHIGPPTGSPSPQSGHGSWAGVGVRGCLTPLVLGGGLLLVAVLFIGDARGAARAVLVVALVAVLMLLGGRRLVARLWVQLPIAALLIYLGWVTLNQTTA